MVDLLVSSVRLKVAERDRPPQREYALSRSYGLCLVDTSAIQHLMPHCLACTHPRLPFLTNSTACAPWSPAAPAALAPPSRSTSSTAALPWSPPRAHSPTTHLAHRRSSP